MLEHWLTRLDDGTFDVKLTGAPGEAGPYPGELEAHEAAYAMIRQERDQANRALAITMRRIKACLKMKEGVK